MYICVYFFLTKLDTLYFSGHGHHCILPKKIKNNVIDSGCSCLIEGNLYSNTYRMLVPLKVCSMDHKSYERVHERKNSFQTNL